MNMYSLEAQSCTGVESRGGGRTLAPEGGD